MSSANLGKHLENFPFSIAFFVKFILLHLGFDENGLHFTLLLRYIVLQKVAIFRENILQHIFEEYCFAKTGYFSLLLLRPDS